MLFFCKGLKFGMQQSVVGGIPWVALMKLNFKSWRIGSIFGTFV
jgi:hypothetical protein